MATVPQLAPVDTQTDTLDSFYQYVKQRIESFNVNRQFGGIVSARDWPFKTATPEAFYLMIDKSSPSKNVKSWQSPLYTFSLQWTWLIIGTDVAPTVLAANRGDKYRTNGIMQEEMLNGLYPGFCEKQQYKIQPNPINNQPQVVAVGPYVPSEKLWWDKPNFSEKIDRNTGILFSYGSVRVSSFAPAINS